jgi:hypothetical protein
MNEQNQQQQEGTANVYKTSKTTWFLLGFLGVIAAVVIFMIMRKKKDGAGGVAEMGAPVAPSIPTNM